MKIFRGLLIAAAAAAAGFFAGTKFEAKTSAKPSGAVPAAVKPSKPKPAEKPSVSQNFRLLRSAFLGNELVLTFDTPDVLDRNSMKPVITPQGNYEYFAEGKKLLVTGDFTPGTRYTVRLPASARDSAGRTLGLDIETSVARKDYEPSFQFLTEGRYLPLHSKTLELPYSSVNTETIEVVLKKDYENNIHPFHTSHIGNYGTENMLELVRENRKLNTVRNRKTNGMFDLGALLPKRTPGFYILQVRRTDSVYYSTVSREFFLTDLAVQTAFDAVADKVVVHVRSIETGKPVEGAFVRVLSKKNQSVAAGKTDRAGIAVLLASRFDALHDAPAGILVKKQDDVVYFRLTGTRPAKPETPNAFVFAERGVCRPGESFRIGAFVRDSKLLPLRNAPAVLTVKSPDGAKFASIPVKTDVHGFAAAPVTLPGSAATGNYRFSCGLSEKETWGTGSILVAAYVPDRIKVKLEGTEEPVSAATPMDYRLSANYYFGPAVENAEYRFQIRCLTAPLPREWNGWTVGDPDSMTAPRAFQVRAPMKNGEQKITYPGFASMGGHAFGPVRVFAEGTVTENGGRSVTASTSAVLYPADSFLGLRENDGKRSDVKNIELKLLGVPGKNAVTKSDLKIRILLYSKEWEYTLKTTDGRVSREWTERETPCKDHSRELRIPAGTKTGEFLVPIAFRGLPSGCYKMTAEADGELRTVLEFWHWAGEGGKRSADPRSLTFKTNASLYQPGDTAKITFQSPFDGEMMIAAGEKNIEKQFVVKIKRGKNRLILRIPAGIRSSAYFAKCELIGKVNGEYERSAGELALPVDQTGKHRLTVRFDIPEKVTPGESLEIPVTVSSGKGRFPGPGTVLLYAVDEGVLSLTGYETPDLFNAFYGPGSPAFHIQSMYELIFPNLKIMPDGRIGGDAALLCKSAAARMPDVVKQKESVRILLPPQTVDAEGKTVFKVTIPNHLGSLRFFALASSEEAVGGVSRNTVVRKKVTASVAGPRVLAPGDRTEFNFTLFNHEMTDSAFRLIVTLPSNLKTSSKTVIDGTLEKGKSVNLTVPVTATDAVGTEELKWDFRIGNALDSDGTFVTIRPLNPKQTVCTVATLGPGKSATPAFDRSEWFGKPEAKLRICPSPASMIPSALDWLNDYPYGCLEQTVSGAFPFLAVDSMVKSGILTREAGNAVRHKAAAGYRRILPLGLSTGAFTMWPGSTAAWNDASIYAVHYIFEGLNRNLFPAYESTKRLYRTFLREIAEREVKNRGLRAYAVYVLAVAGDPSARTYAYHILSEKKIDYASFLAGAALIRAGYASTGFPHVKKAIENGCWTESSVPMPYSSETSRLGMTLYILMRSGIPEEETSARLAGLLASKIRPDGTGWGTTQSNAWAALGLAAWAEKYPPAPLSGTLDGKPFNSSKTLEFPFRGTETLENRSPAPMMVQCLVTGYPVKPRKTAGFFRLNREYLREDGTPAREIRRGDAVYVRVTVGSPASVRNVAVCDILPAGFEIEDGALLTRSATNLKAFSGVASCFTSERREKRDDRYLIFGDCSSGTSQFVYKIRAISRGTFHVPMLHAENMYVPEQTGTFAPMDTLTVQ